MRGNDPPLVAEIVRQCVLLDNNYTDVGVYVQSSGLDALHVTAAHEFNHALQFGYYQGSDGIWWQEATATWMEDVVYPEVDDYLQYFSSFLRYPEESLDRSSSSPTDLHVYGACLFAHFLEQRYGAAAVRQIWEEFGSAGNARIGHFGKVISTYDSGGLASAVAEFGTWNYFTGSRYRAGYDRDGDEYPSVYLWDVSVDISEPNVALEDVSDVDHLGSTYLRLQPKLTLGGVQVQVEPRGTGQWRQHLVLAGADSVQVLPLEQGVKYVTGWDRYQEVVLVLTQVDRPAWATGLNNVTYDPDLVDDRRPLPCVWDRSGPTRSGRPSTAQ